MKTTRRDFLGKMLIGLAGVTAMSAGLPVLVKPVAAKVPKSDYPEAKIKVQEQVGAMLHSYNLRNESAQFVMHPSVKAKIDSMPPRHVNCRSVQWHPAPDARFAHLHEARALHVDECPPQTHNYIEGAEYKFTAGKANTGAPLIPKGHLVHLIPEAPIPEGWELFRKGMPNLVIKS